MLQCCYVFVAVQTWREEICPIKRSFTCVNRMSLLRHSVLWVRSTVNKILVPSSKSVHLQSRTLFIVFTVMILNNFKSSVCLIEQGVVFSDFRAHSTAE